MKKPENDEEWAHFHKRCLKKKMQYWEKHKAKKKEEYLVSPQYYLNEVRYGNRCGSHVNCFRLHTQNSAVHEFAKFLKFFELRMRKHDVLVEPIFVDDGGRPDILDLKTGTIYEVRHSEGVKEFRKKLCKYPGCFVVEDVKAEEVLKK